MRHNLTSTGILRNECTHWCAQNLRPRNTWVFQHILTTALSHQHTCDKTAPFQSLLCRKLEHPMPQVTNNRNGRKDIKAHICYFNNHVLTWLYFSLLREAGEFSLAIHKAVTF